MLARMLPDCSLSGVITLLIMGAFGCIVSPPACTHFFSQPGRLLFIKSAHIDAEVSEDIVSSPLTVILTTSHPIVQASESPDYRVVPPTYFVLKSYTSLINLNVRKISYLIT